MFRGQKFVNERRFCRSTITKWVNSNNVLIDHGLLLILMVDEHGNVNTNKKIPNGCKDTNNEAIPFPNLNIGKTYDSLLYRISSEAT